jgi:acylphosphatase
MPTKRFVVTGHVQGVGYRFFTVAAAENCHLTGFVRNLADGSVEAVASGDSRDLDRFREMLASGPELAHVADVREQDHEAQERWNSFDIREIGKELR